MLAKTKGPMCLDPDYVYIRCENINEQKIVNKIDDLESQQLFQNYENFYLYSMKKKSESRNNNLQSTYMFFISFIS